MKFNKFIWDNYRQTLRGQNKIKEFFNVSQASDRELIEQICAFNGNAFNFYTPESFIDAISFFQYAYGKMIEETPINNIELACELYESIAVTEILDSSGKTEIPAGDYQFLLQANSALSYVLHFFHPDFFIPNLYCFNFEAFIRLCNSYEDFSLPPIPKKSDYRSRYLYYAELCRLFFDIRTKWGLSSAEFCAFLYDFAPASIVQEEEQKELPQPSAIWCIGGNEDEPKGLWQCNEETKRGDIILYYRKSPTSAITHIFRADSDGLIDPFFHYYSRVKICSPIRIPNISCDFLKTDEYFSEHPLIKKNFQGVNGWPFKYRDYQRLLEILSGKGVSTSGLPDLPKVEAATNVQIKLERDVEEKLLNPYLAQCGVSPEDYIRQMPLHMGRGDVKYPDYAVYPYTEEGYETAQILIEAKLEIKNNREREDAFRQARSYALRLQSNYIILCDKNYMWIYSGADGVNYERYSWAELRTADIFSKMKKLFSKSRKKMEE